MTETISEEEVRQYINDRIKEVIQEALRIKLEKVVDEVVEGVHSKLDLDPDQEDVDVERIAAECVLDAMYGSNTPKGKTNVEPDTSEGRTAEIAVGGRTNEGTSTEITLEEYDAPTKSKEVPLRGGDVEDPETIEIEVPDPDLSQARWNESLTPEQEQYIWEERYADDGEEFDPETVPKGGFPWYQ